MTLIFSLIAFAAGAAVGRYYPARIDAIVARIRSIRG